MVNGCAFCYDVHESHTPRLTSEKDVLMKKKRTKSKKEKQQIPKRKGPIDPYTGKVEPPAEGAYKVKRVETPDPGNRLGENFLINEEDSLDKLALDSNADAISE